MKRILTIVFIGLTSVIYGQRLSFNITNDSIKKEFYLTKITNEIVETITIESFNFNVDINLDEGYYFLKKEDEKTLLYLKRNDEFTISFDGENFLKSLTFSGKRGAGRNTYLHSKNIELLDQDGNLNTFYKRNFYEGNENKYVRRLDQYYKGFYGTIFGSGFEESFINEESKNLQYGYYLDILKFEKAKKYYDFKDSIQISKAYLAPLRSVLFDNQLFSDRYQSYNDLAVLKWQIDIEKTNNYSVMKGIIASIRTEAIQKALLVRLYETMAKDDPNRMRAYLDLIKAYSKDNQLIARSKAKLSVIAQEEAEKNLSRFSYLNTNGEEVKLADFKGNYIFLYLWATFCKDCVNEFKNIEKLRDNFEDKNIVFVGVSVDKKEDFDKWSGLVNESGIKTSAMQLFFDDARSKLIKAYEISSIPALVLLSLKGEKMKIDIKEIDSKKTQRSLRKLFDKLE
ncbi:TlpA family protein disulfide reductase [Tenacibaculum sp. SZ-18]|uniref:TlpA family protein disulfide reductase n=1 Tax=Tenacibaculum sp. SZ-18 TaxID=754423 RepID=UPI000C2CF9D1|nr:TlpA disulfide reductase family protein [Tenacibaculum sp. SZ-18]